MWLAGTKLALSFRAPNFYRPGYQYTASRCPADGRLSRAPSDLSESRRKVDSGRAGIERPKDTRSRQLAEKDENGDLAHTPTHMDVCLVTETQITSLQAPRPPLEHETYQGVVLRRLASGLCLAVAAVDEMRERMDLR